MYVASVSFGCCKSISGYCIYMHVASICFKCFIRMFASVSSWCCICLQWFSNVFQAFSQVFKMLVSSVSYVFFCMLQLLHMFVMVFKCFSGVFASVSDACFKCFIYFLLYVATVVSVCFKSRSDVAHVIRMGSTGGMNDVRGSAGPVRVRSLASPTR